MTSFWKISRGLLAFFISATIYATVIYLSFGIISLMVSIKASLIIVGIFAFCTILRYFPQSVKKHYFALENNPAKKLPAKKIANTIFCGIVSGTISGAACAFLPSLSHFITCSPFVTFTIISVIISIALSLFCYLDAKSNAKPLEDTALRFNRQSTESSTKSDFHTQSFIIVNNSEANPEENSVSEELVKNPNIIVNDSEANAEENSNSEYFSFDMTI